MQTGKVQLAERLFKQVLQSQPKHVPTLNLLSVLLTRSGRFDEAERYVRLALAENATSDATYYNYGLILKALKRPAEAAERFTQALKLNAAVAESWNNRGTVFSDLRRYREAIADFDRAIALNKDYADAFFNKGNALAALKSYRPALVAYDRAVALGPDRAEAWLGRGNVLTELNEYDNAFAAYDRAFALQPDRAGAWLGRGNVFAAMQRYDEALAAYDKALAVEPDLAEAWLGRGNVFAAVARSDNALAAFDKALALKPDLAKAWLGRGNIFIRGKRYDDALSAYDRALALDPELAEAWLGRGNVFIELGRYDDAGSAYDRALTLNSELAAAWLGRGLTHSALKRYVDGGAAFDRALALQPDLAEAWLGRGGIHEALQQYDQACAAYQRAVALRPDLNGAAGVLMLAKQFICDWTDFQGEAARLLTAIRAGQLASAPGIILALPSSAADQLQCAKRYVQERPSFPPIWRGEAYSHDRIRVAYLSADFREHAVAYLTAGLFENHDKSRFHTTAISFGPNQDTPTRRRLMDAFEQFVDVRLQSDQEVADLIRRLEIDIVVDLMGVTGNHRLEVMSRRPAPIQVNYLGYSGTTGADYIDYILADSTVVPERQCRFYTEQVVWLPDCYLINDNRRVISERTPNRQECGLPESGFVFCCFNNPYKLAPETFGIWMRLLTATPGSVLWLSELNATARANLRREAERGGVSAERLIFAPRMAQVADHLARLRQADLFLDTLPYNAHTTAADALWAGVPVLTCLGTTFAGRVAASLLKAVGLDQLIAPSPKDYEALALQLAHDPARLAAVKDALARNRNCYPLFDTARTTRQIEAAYSTMWQRYRRGEAAPPRGEEAKPIRIA